MLVYLFYVCNLQGNIWNGFVNCIHEEVFTGPEFTTDRVWLQEQRLTSDYINLSTY